MRLSRCGRRIEPQGKKFVFRAKCIICPALLAALTIGLGSAGCKMKPFPRMSLEEAAKAGDVEQIDANLYGGAKVNAANAEGVTALHLAALGGHKEAVVFLVEKGADIKARTSGPKLAPRAFVRPSKGPRVRQSVSDRHIKDPEMLLEIGSHGIANDIAAKQILMTGQI